MLTIAALLFIGFGFSFCAKCVTCDFIGYDGNFYSNEYCSNEICSDGFGGTLDYDQTIDAIEALEGTCN